MDKVKKTNYMVQLVAFKGVVISYDDSKPMPTQNEAIFTILVFEGSFIIWYFHTLQKIRLC